MQKEPFLLKESTYLTLASWQILDSRVSVGMSTRRGGFSTPPFNSLNLGLHVNDRDQTVLLNRDKLANDLWFPMHRWVFCEQVHGNSIKKVTSNDCNAGVESLETVIKGVDGLYTSDSQVMIATLYADCVPIYFFAPKHHTIGLAHAGWNGTVGNIVKRMIQEWVTNENIPVDEIQVAIGPSIGMDQYEVDEKVITQVNTVLDKNESKPYVKTKNDKYKLNLKLLNRQLLEKEGVLPQNIVETSYCTSTDNDLFFSYRKEKGITGRMVSFIGYYD